jgi:hypothetical protein
VSAAFQLDSPLQRAIDAALPVKVRDGQIYVRCSDATANYLTSRRQEIECPLTCSCSQRPYPHELHVHNKHFERPGSYDAYEERIFFADETMRWPWSLRFAPDMEG